MRYLSDEWLEAANVAVAPMEPVADAAIAFAVTDETAEVETIESYVLDLGPESVRYHRDLSRAELTLRMSRSTAIAIANGSLSAQRSFLSGDLQVAGDVRVLLGHTKAMADIDDYLSPVRAATDFS